MQFSSFLREDFHPSLPHRAVGVPAGPTRRPHHPEAAAHAGLHVAAAERGHFAQLPRDLDGFVEQQAEVALVRQAAGTRHLTEQVCEGQK